MTLFTPDELSALHSMNEYWTEIQARNEPERTKAIHIEALKVAHRIGPERLLQLIQFYLKHIKEPIEL